MPKCLEALNGGEEGGRGVRELLREGVCVCGGGGEREVMMVYRPHFYM